MGPDRSQTLLFPESLEEYVAAEIPCASSMPSSVPWICGPGREEQIDCRRRRSSRSGMCLVDRFIDMNWVSRWEALNSWNGSWTARQNFFVVMYDNGVAVSGNFTILC
jgi:hypothetical protein